MCRCPGVELMKKCPKCNSKKTYEYTGKYDNNGFVIENPDYPNDPYGYEKPSRFACKKCGDIFR